VRGACGAKMTVNDFYDALLCALAVYVGFKFWKKFVHRPRVWVLDDSESDMMLFKMNIKLDECDLRYFTSPQGIINAYIKSLATFGAPSCIVIDYYLSDKIKGDEVLDFFKKNGVKGVVVTGYDGAISNIAERDIIRKTPNQSYFRQVEAWILNATGLRS